MLFLCPKGGEKKVLEKTNLEKVKMIARALLMTEIHETEFSPAVVQHPFTSSGITIPGDDGIERRIYEQAVQIYGD